MRGARHIILVDGDLKRRAAISHFLGGHGIHVEPFETVVELSGHQPRQGLIMVNDLDGTIPALTAQLVQSGSWLPIVAFSENPAPRRIVDAILGGAIDYLAWPFDAAELTETLEYAEERAQNVGNAKLREAMARNRIERLTPRERDVLVGIAAGHSNRTIADNLAISPRTVEIHRANMLHKIGATHTSEAIRIAIEASLAGEPQPLD
ncbi:LuxR C-terminal-related transcriptional regulator [Novosphingobium sp. G106]|uniref:response regulator transcription factor n=1 Tax=Novosphingobium sp. G106 TaxID=2849500 RepID=UPI001C2D581D|nr:LuxR C-terminal-related transcriptional regulator [Novosphingobium sp. G106]MBV1690673.1 LuxR C-terminal-related transcriptional regulator [Novosphingobium sp. G106]